MLRDVLRLAAKVRWEEHAREPKARRDLVYAQICRLQEVNALSSTGPIAIPPGRKAVEVAALRAQLRRKIAKQNCDLAAEDLIVYRDKRFDCLFERPMHSARRPR